MTDRIQELMEELGQTGRIMLAFDPRSTPWGAEVDTGASPDRFSAAYGDTPIEALTKLRDKVKPRTPEDVVHKALRERGFKPLSGTDSHHIVAALRDAGMLREGESYECSCGEQFTNRTEQQRHCELKLHTAVTRSKV